MGAKAQTSILGHTVLLKVRMPFVPPECMQVPSFLSIQRCQEQNKEESGRGHLSPISPSSPPLLCSLTSGDTVPGCQCNNAIVSAMVHVLWLLQQTQPRKATLTWPKNSHYLPSLPLRLCRALQGLSISKNMPNAKGEECKTAWRQNCTLPTEMGNLTPKYDN